MADNGGNLKLTGQAFTQLRAAVKDLTDEAKDAKSAIEDIFKGDHFDGSGFFTGEDDRFIASIAKSFEALSGLVDRLNAKLAITNVRLASIFSTSSKAWEKAAKQIEKVTKAASKGPVGGGSGGNKGGNDWWNQGPPESFDPFRETPTEDSGPWKANWVSSLDAVISADKLLKKTEKDRAKEADFIAKQRAKSADDTYKRLVQQTKLEEKLRKEQEKRKKIVENNSFVSELAFLGNIEKFQKKVAGRISPDAFVSQRMSQSLYKTKVDTSYESDMAQMRAFYTKQAAKAERVAEKSNFIPQMAIVQKANKFAQEAEAKAAKARAAAAAKEKMDASSPHIVDRMLGRFLNASFMRWKLNMAARTMVGNSMDSLTRGGASPFGKASRFFGGAGAIGSGLVGKFRVFRNPFPGSERNVFALGDLAASFNNIVYGIGGSLENAFNGVTGAAISVNKAFAGVATGLISVFSPTLAAILGSLADLFTGVLQKLSSVVTSVIGGLTRLATSLTGFATRAVEAAANFTETVNAARVVAGPKAAMSMQAEAMRLQREYGLSATDAMRGMGRIAGTLVQQGGFSPAEAGMQAEVIARSLADVASVNNRNLEDLMRDFMSGAVGRLTPLRKNMISMSAQQLDMYAKNAGLKNPNLRTDLMARTKVMIPEFLRQADLFAGDLERTRYEFANQRRKFLGGFEALFLSVGRILEPFGKTVIFVANQIMDQVLGLVSSLADNPYETFKNTIQQFAVRVIEAKNIVISFAKGLYESRDQIVEWAGFIGKRFLELTLFLVRYSGNTLKVFANFLQGLNSLMPIFDFFGNALLSLGQAIAKLIPTTDKTVIANQNKIAQMHAEMRAIQSGKSEYGLSPRMESERQRRLDFLRSQIAQTARNMDQPTPVQDLLLGTGSMLENTAVNLNRFADEFNKALEPMLGDAEANKKEASRILGLLKPVESMPGKVAPPPAVAAGNLVRYFDPAQFRDAVQEREVANAQLRTAEATEGILQVLQQRGGSVLRSPGTLLQAPSSFGIPGGGVVTLP